MSSRNKSKSRVRPLSQHPTRVCYDRRNLNSVVRFLYGRRALQGEVFGEMSPLAMPEIEVALHTMISEMVANPDLQVVSMREGVDLVRESLEGGTLTVYFMVNPLAGEERSCPVEFWATAPDVEKLGRQARAEKEASV